MNSMSVVTVNTTKTQVMTWRDTTTVAKTMLIMRINSIMSDNTPRNIMMMSVTIARDIIGILMIVGPVDLMSLRGNLSGYIDREKCRAVNVTCMTVVDKEQDTIAAHQPGKFIPETNRGPETLDLQWNEPLQGYQSCLDAQMDLVLAWVSFIYQIWGNLTAQSNQQLPIDLVALVVEKGKITNGNEGQTEDLSRFLLAVKNTTGKNNTTNLHLAARLKRSVWLVWNRRCWKRR
mmetsp:Transcript_36488/g.75945  ORF Transcript_36488/g.75945 Transcript_36488/m.75945 type:complete len:233 (+) Transcript_36488:1075-1773(+)